MNPEIISALGVIVLGIFAGFFALMKYIVKTLSELKPNGGSSMKDQVNRLEVRVDDIYNILLQKEINAGK
jgi:hypothetical protein